MAASVVTTSVDSSGNLLLNGNPFLVVAGQKTEYSWWEAAGYTQAQADTKMSEMVSSGCNALDNGDWLLSDDGVTYQDQRAWQQHSLYWIGHATSDLSKNIQQSLDATTIATVVGTYKSRPNLLRWGIANEFNADTQNLATYASAASYVHADDPTRIVGDLAVTGTVQTFTVGVGPTMMQQVLAEVNPNYGNPAPGIQGVYYALLDMQQARAAGTVFVPGISITPLQELGIGGPAFAALPISSNFLQFIRRAFLLSVAMDARAFEMLWGPNQRDGVTYPNTGDAGLPPGYLQAWEWSLQAVSQVAQLSAPILAPGTWKTLTTNPPFAIGPIVNNIQDFQGIYAAKKTVGGVTYVIAVNLNQVNGIDVAVTGATINMGQTITEPFPETSTPTFSGSSIITDSFLPMDAHVYRIQD